MSKNKISVCMAVYNGRKYILEQLQSVFEQSRKADEVIICDDGSTDGTIELVRSFIAEHKLQDSWCAYCNEERKGYPGNFYYAMSLCRGDIVFPADQDDIWERHKIREMSRLIGEDESILLLASAWQTIDKDGRLIGKRTGNNKTSCREEKLINISVEQIYHKYLWPGMSMCYRQNLGQSVLDKVQGTGLAHDVALALCAAEEGGFRYMDCCLQYHRNHEENVAMEEHRLNKRLNKQRKLVEIQRYLDMLHEIVANPALQGEKKRIAVQKQEIMQERLQNLAKSNLWKIVRQYWSHRNMIRISTVICDCLICFGKADGEL